MDYEIKLSLVYYLLVFLTSVHVILKAFGMSGLTLSSSSNKTEISNIRYTQELTSQFTLYGTRTSVWSHD